MFNQYFVLLFNAGFGKCEETNQHEHKKGSKGSTNQQNMPHDYGLDQHYYAFQRTVQFL